VSEKHTFRVDSVTHDWLPEMLILNEKMNLLEEKRLCEERE
jgi:hypothetical protein